jgi:hypothetical protein
MIKNKQTTILNQTMLLKITEARIKIRKTESMKEILNIKQKEFRMKQKEDREAK